MSRVTGNPEGDRRRTLWVGKGFAQPGQGDYKFELLVWDLFSADVRINRGFPPDRGRRPGDVGIDSQEGAGVYWLERLNKIIHDAGADTIREFSPYELLEYDGPVVAKINNTQRGEGKYLLRTHEDKIRMALFSLLKADVIGKLSIDTDIARRDKYFIELIEKLKRGDVNGPEFLSKKEMRPFKFEQYIETPSNCFTSFRIVVDAFGHIHSELLLYSATTKDQAMKAVRSVSTQDNRAQLYDSYLLSPKSLFYIPTPSIVSNHAMGGGQINFLYPNSNEQGAIREEILKAHSFDTTAPELPLELIDLAKDLGWRFGQEYLYTGLDFILDAQTGKYYLLEMNARPMIDPEDIGLSSQEYTSDSAEIELLRRIKSTMTTSRIPIPPAYPSKSLRKKRGLTT